MDKGFENPKEMDWLFCNVFFIIILYIFIPVGGIKKTPEN